MIPCKKTCADYYEGCHKNCERWKHFLQQSSAERKEKKSVSERLQRAVQHHRPPVPRQYAAAFLLGIVCEAKC